MRVQARILICQIRIRNMVVLVSQINRSAVAGREQLHTATQLSSKVELLSRSKHSMAEIQETATAGKKGLDVAVVNEVHLRTDRAASNAVGVRAPASTGVPVADQRHGDSIENPAHREWTAPIDEPFVAALELVISRANGARKCVPVFKSSTKPIGKLAVRTLLLLCDGRC